MCETLEEDWNAYLPCPKQSWIRVPLCDDRADPIKQYKCPGGFPMAERAAETFEEVVRKALEDMRTEY